MHSNTLHSLIIALAFCTNMQGMETSPWLPKDYCMIEAYDAYRHLPDPIILEYDDYELEISRACAQQLPPVAASTSNRWKNNRYVFDSFNHSFTHDGIIDITEPLYSRKHISQLLSFCHQPEDSPHHAIAIDDIDPLLRLADMLTLPEDPLSAMHDSILTTLNTTLATEEACGAEKQKALEIYYSMVQEQNAAVVKQIANKAETEGALTGIYNIMYSSSAWQKALTENKPSGPAFNAWKAKDPGKQLFDVFVQHKKSIKTFLEQHDIDITQSNQLQYWKQKYKREKKRTDKKIQMDILNVIAEHEEHCESIHDVYLLPKGWLFMHSWCCTSMGSQYLKFSHFPLIRYFSHNERYDYPYALNVLITPIDWQNILSIDGANKKHMKLPQNYQLTIPEPYKALYKQKIKKGFLVIKKIKQQPADAIAQLSTGQKSNSDIEYQQVHTKMKESLDRLIQPLEPAESVSITPNTKLMINACALGLIATTVYATYKFRQHCASQQTMLAHNFLQTHVTTATRPTYQFLYTISPNQYSLDCKQILDKALLTQHMVGPITLDQGTALHCNQNLLELHSASASLESYKSDSSVIGYFGFPLLCEAISALAFNTSIVQRTTAGITYLYKRLFGATNTETKKLL